MDRELVVRAQDGDQRAFEALALADSPRLHRVAYGILRDSESAEDATQRALVDIWRDIRRLRDPAKYEAWSYRLLVHACYREARQRRDLPRITDVPEPWRPLRSTRSGRSTTATSWSAASARSRSNTGRSSCCAVCWTCP